MFGFCVRYLLYMGAKAEANTRATAKAKGREAIVSKAKPSKAKEGTRTAKVS